MHLWNAVFAPERAYTTMTDRFESALDLLWYRADNNDYPKEDATFDEHRNPTEALAAKAIQNTIQSSNRGREEDKLIRPKQEAS